MVKILVTGAAGFIGAAVCHALLARGDAVIAIDNQSDYYDVRLKEGRPTTLTAKKTFTFRKVDIADKTAVQALAVADISRIYAAGIYEVLEGADGVVILTEWNEFLALDLTRVKAALKTPLMVNLRNIYRPVQMAEAGFRYVSVGRN